MNAPDSGVTVVVDQDLCMGSRYCVTQHPDLFGEDADGTAVSLQTERLSPEQARGAAEAAHVCPAAAIEVRRLS
ncbi:ferredoxin [Mycobacteroides saopaulense]|uniref:ferredoxin n=1 Tax=Mycobacteroides saopaulense TaxID=1578165 RepID=UPI000B4D01AC|nr:ferredoxin [Mycobacteroides saopaulense]